MSVLCGQVPCLLSHGRHLLNAGKRASPFVRKRAKIPSAGAAPSASKTAVAPAPPQAVILPRYVKREIGNHIATINRVDFIGVVQSVRMNAAGSVALDVVVKCERPGAEGKMRIKLRVVVKGSRYASKAGRIRRLSVVHVTGQMHSQRDYFGGGTGHINVDELCGSLTLLQEPPEEPIPVCASASAAEADALLAAASEPTPLHRGGVDTCLPPTTVVHLLQSELAEDTKQMLAEDLSQFLLYSAPFWQFSDVGVTLPEGHGAGPNADSGRCLLAQREAWTLDHALIVMGAMKRSSGMALYKSLRASCFPYLLLERRLASDSQEMKDSSDALASDDSSDALASDDSSDALASDYEAHETELALVRQQPPLPFYHVLVCWRDPEIVADVLFDIAFCSPYRVDLNDLRSHIKVSTTVLDQYLDSHKSYLSDLMVALRCTLLCQFARDPHHRRFNDEILALLDHVIPVGTDDGNFEDLFSLETRQNFARCLCDFVMCAHTASNVTGTRVLQGYLDLYERASRKQPPSPEEEQAEQQPPSPEEEQAEQQPPSPEEEQAEQEVQQDSR